MDIKEIREQIDRIDDDILRLFIERMGLSGQVAEFKRQAGLPITDRSREREILAAAAQKAGQWEPYAYQLFSRLLELSKARQGELLFGEGRVTESARAALLPENALFPKTGTVACQGVEGANSQAACDRLIPRGRIVFVKTFDAVCSAVESGLCDFGVLPVENSAGGSVRAVYELLRERNVSIVRATKLCIRHCLLALPGARLEDIRLVRSHEQAIGQCGKFLSSLDAAVEPCGNTAAAAKALAESGDMSAAAIASPECAQLYGLSVLKSDIQDSDNNYTRFICVAAKPAIYPGADHISLVVSCGNHPGALSGILSMIAAQGINMNKIESCPVTGRSFEYVFIIDLEASIREPGVLPMLEALERESESFTLLGCYPVV